MEGCFLKNGLVHKKALEASCNLASRAVFIDRWLKNIEDAEEK
jgi:hypothetical protein